jgi:outer membrane autotransporter protein
MLMETADYVKPVGAYGPAAASGPWRGWAGAYGENGSRDGSGVLSGYDAAVYGTALGLDRAFDNMVIGLSGGLSGSSIDQDDGDTSDASTVYGALYATVRLKEIDWDLMGSYGNISIENSSGTVFDSDAETDASTMVFYVSASEEAVSGPFTFAPLVAFQAAHFDQEGYDEVSANAIGRAVDSYDRWSYKSILGATAGTVKPMAAFDLIIRGSASWQHEFNTDVDTLNYTLIGGTDPHFFKVQAPVEDLFDVGIHVGALIGGRLEVGAGIDGRFSGEYSAASYNARVQYTF